MMFGIESHAVVAFTTSHRIASNDFVRRGIDDCEDILILQIHIDFLSNGVVLRHTGLAVEMQRLHNFVLFYINDALRSATLVRNIELLEPGCMSAAVGLAF